MNHNLKNLLNTIIITFLIFIGVYNAAFAVSSVDMNLETNSQNTSAENAVAENTTNSTLSNTAVGTVSNLSPLPESDLGFANVLNIILIAVGVVLILLGIAILIELKK